MKLQDLAKTNSEPLFSRKRVEEIQREVLFSPGQFSFAVAVGKKGNMECLKSHSNGLRIILQNIKIVCKLSFQILGTQIIEF